MSRVDIIVPCYGYGHFLEECVESALTQQGIDVRVLILDDASPDNTPEVGKGLAGRDQRVTYRRHPINCGHISTYNEGLDWASADYLLLLSADDLLVPGALERAGRMLDTHPKMNLVFGNVINRYSDGTDELVWPLGETAGASGGRILAGDEFIRISGPRNIVPTPTAIVRTTAQKQVGGYRKELPHAGDLEMWLRLAATGDIGFVSAVQAVYRRHGSNMSATYEGERVLADLRQRELAFNMFRRENAAYLDAHPSLSNYLRAELAREAVRIAGMALNEQKYLDARHIMKFALQVDPQIWLSWPWAKNLAKQLLGHRVSRALRPQ